MPLPAAAQDEIVIPAGRSSDESHDALLGPYGKRFDLQIEVGRSEQIEDLWPPAE